MARKIVIIGAGTYGSYLAKSLTDKDPDDEIHLFEVGDETARSEKEIGYLSTLTSRLYRGASDGRFFGLGGTSEKWGGQLLFFSENDFADDHGMREMIDCNIRYRDKVLSRFFSKVPELKEQRFDDELFIKQGIWLKFGRRNIFNTLKVAELPNVTIHRNARVVRLNVGDGGISSISVSFAEREQPVRIEADVYYLTSGAFESVRLLHVSGIIDARETTLGFSDHVSLRCFQINQANARIADHDFQFRFVEGSMHTSRIVGEIDGVSFFAHPIFNEEFTFFQFLKLLIIKKKFSGKGFLTAGKQILPVLAFVATYLFKKKLYIYGRWFLHIDIELANSNNSVALSPETDRFHEQGIDIKYQISEETVDKMLRARQKVRQILLDANIDFEDLETADISTEKMEDVYHPFALFSHSGNQTIFDLYNPVSNLFMFNTGLLRRAGGLNPTASIFCLIEHHVDGRGI
jgi:hypothetical protein